MNVLHLCAGIDGFGLALDATPTWVADNDPDAAAVLAHHYPNTPNLGDVWSADWAALGTVDVLCAGYPCQPFSTAGQRKGTEDERHLWPAIRDAIAHTRPGLVLLENVRGHLSLGFDIVLGDLADLRFDAEWAVFTSAEIGAPHRRERLYIAATPNPAGVGRDGRAWQPDAEGRAAEDRVAGYRRDAVTPLLPTPTSADGKGGGCAPSKVRPSGAKASINLRDIASGLSLLPTVTTGCWPSMGARAEASGWKPAPTLGDIAICRSPLLPTLTASDGLGGRLGDTARAHELAGTDYWPAVQRWARITGTNPPPFVHVGPQGGHSVDARFAEWMMGYAAGWVTDLGLSNSRALKLLGNSVQPQTARLAIGELTQRLAVA
jgi:DNA (cytosine-5)-methyltransferase 1